MSRATKSNDEYTMAFGVDHTPMGYFFQIWEKAAKGEIPEQDEAGSPQIYADEQYGLTISNPKTLERNPKLLSRITNLQNYYKGFPFVALRTEDIIIGIGRACGLIIGEEVYQLWD